MTYENSGDCPHPICSFREKLNLMDVCLPMIVGNGKSSDT